MIIDWLSFTLPTEKTERDDTARDEMLRAIQNLSMPLYNYLWSYGISTTSPRRPYDTAFRNHDMYMYSGKGLNNCLVEASGQGCAKLREIGLMDTIIDSNKARFTRVDIALDILGVDPDEIIAEGYSDRFRTHSRIASDIGVTHYVGSVKSERYARVYRYKPPHDRSNLCRIETVYRKRYAKIIIDEIRSKGVIDAGLAGLSSYQFKHSAIPASEDNVLATVAIVKSNQSTMRWILAQVAPALRRLIADGTIENPEQFFRENFIP